MPNFKRGDVLEYVRTSDSIPGRVGSIAIVESIGPYDGLTVRWILPTWEYDVAGEQDAGISTRVFKRLTHASV